MSTICFEGRSVPMNNMLFDRLVFLAVAVAERTAAADEQRFVDRMKTIRDQSYPGRGFDIEEDFPDLTERKFWCRVFFDTARAVFDGTVGLQEHRWWQSLTIHLTCASAELFEEAVRRVEPEWRADTQDRREEMASREAPPSQPPC